MGQNGLVASILQSPYVLIGSSIPALATERKTAWFQVRRTASRTKKIPRFWWYSAQ